MRTPFRLATPMNQLRRFLAGDSALAITEYGLLVAFIALIIIAVVIILGGGLSSWFGSKTSQITTV